MVAEGVATSTMSILRGKTEKLQVKQRGCASVHAAGIGKIGMTSEQLEYSNVSLNIIIQTSIFI